MAERQDHCQNDGTKLSGDYCHTCGQSADEPRRVFIGLVQDVFVDTLAIDGKLARTIWLLLSRPARLAQRYLEGKRVRYSPPFRLYLFTSIFFFLAFFLTTDFSDIDPSKIDPENLVVTDETLSEIETQDPEAAARLREFIELEPAESTQNTNEDESAEENSDDRQVDFSFADSTWEDANYEGPEWVEPHLQRMFEAAQRVAKDPRLFVAEIRENLPRTLLLAPILYALILSLLYIYRRKFFVYDHFVISLYMHAALYAYLLFAILLSRLPVIGGWAWFVPLVWGWLQPLVIFRQAYGSGWVSAVLKWIVSMTIYSIGLALIITFGLTYSLYQS